MKVVSAFKNLYQGEITRIKEALEGPAPPFLVTAVENARRDWREALRELDHIDRDLDEYVIFKINAAERRYMALLEQARREGVRAWPALAEYPCENMVHTPAGNADNAPICTG
ncbi:DUF2508 family protein [Pelotomaculum propionicicum]|uniref:DUF2508 domain-containing protein n=1 Tax=Pelotomaculum propionicicum TaxID=258475 RepID=A0A4Y7RN03_9FIRM|nr:DUF2508 family protein [Pelotomaculum propionicicum]NLI11103.1 YaaL family protein [Peptococcaceae bacterium]TEB10119.1 hypothetical protein Pmgp_02623 [Pelotomaculum propionicicum]